ncbi:SRPBCC family protein [Galbibacter mesophilus]|uniref:SRPBCC family protein n=1 Tax=Galbibacter mesophilus TaxID=379069 RepID=UPI00191D5840|nr:SRPBCC domain-containing protein [Galbibacter mesophilus]MCM5663060.1 SRPBCC domain-containing protein [Galbibacter mesophilus]
MKPNVKFDFIVDKEKNTITVKREFNATRQLVWDCYTKSELLDQWFAPKPFATKTKSMDFKEGGHWVYAMIDPEGPEYWGRMDYIKINPIDHYTALDGFCDDNGVLNTELPSATWEVDFFDLNENSMVETLVTYKSLEDLEVVINMGMKEGLESTLEKLEELLSLLQNN